MSIISNHTSPRARGTRAGRHAGLALIHILFMTLLLTMALALPFSGMTGTAAYAQAQQQDAAPSATGAKSTGAQPAAPDATPPQAAPEQKGTQAPTPAPAPAPGAATGPAAGQASPQGSAPAATPAASAAPVPAAPAKPLAADAVTADSINGAVQKQLTHIHDQLTGFQKSVHQDADDDADLAALRVKADAIISEMQALSDKLKGRGEQIQSRLTALGDAPKAGAPPETPVVSEERTRLTNERAELNVVSENANQLSNSAVQLGNTITNLRRSLFARTLFRHTELSPDLFTEAAQAQRYQFSDFTSTVGSWLSFVIRFKPLQLVGALILSIGAGLLFLFGGYRLLGRLTRRNDGQEAPSYIRRLSVAFWSTITETVALAAFLSSSFLFLDGFNVLRSDVSTMVASFFGTVWFVFFVAKLSNAVLSPRDQDWRLVRVTNRGAKYLSVAVISMAVINSLDYFLSAVAEALSSPLALTIVKSLVASVIISLIVACISFLKPVMPAGESRRIGEGDGRGSFRSSCASSASCCCCRPSPAISGWRASCRRSWC